MATEKVKRKLTAILSADVKGYSRLMGEDEEWTLRTLNNYKEVMGSFIQQYRGRIVGTAGDSVLAEFGSVVDAVQCAVEIQQALRAKNALLPEDRRMDFRIGINLGDVIEEGDTIYGDGVNIAARLEGLAEPGGICISGSAYEQIENKLPLRYDYLGEHEVKNIAKPVRVFRARIESEAAPSRPPVEVASREKMALPLPDKPSIAVLPFVNMSDDPKQEYFSDGMTEDLITDLSKISGLFVIARNSTFTYKGKPVKVRQVAEELGVRYVLEGSVRRAGDQVRINVQLIDALTGHHLWAERYDRDLKDIFALQDEITLKIISALQVKLTVGERAHVLGKGTENLNAYLKGLQAWEQYLHQNKQGSTMAKQLAKEAIALDPEYAVPYMIIAGSHIIDVWFRFSESPEQSMKLAVEAAQKALVLDDSDPGTHICFSAFYILQRQHDKAIASAERALELGPGEARAQFNLGRALMFACRFNEAIPYYEEAIRLDPFPPSIYFHGLSVIYRFVGRYEEALEQLKKAHKLDPNNLFTNLGLAHTYANLGRMEEARAAAAEVLRLHPKFSLENYAKTMPLKDQSAVDFIIGGLRKAGLR